MLIGIVVKIIVYLIHRFQVMEIFGRKQEQHGNMSMKIILMMLIGSSKPMMIHT